jgi:cell wall-associated NlpC family hydrolase
MGHPTYHAPHELDSLIIDTILTAHAKVSSSCFLICHSERTPFHAASAHVVRQNIGGQRVVAAEGDGSKAASAPGMITPPLPLVGAIAAASLVSLTACGPATLGVSPETIIATVIANIPSSTIESGRLPPRTGRSIPPSPPPSAAASRVLRRADSYVGTRYVWGGNTPREGFDCSGFTKYVFSKYGIALPRTSRAQVRAGSAVAADFGALRPGDLMLFAERGEAISHVAIYAGDGIIIHASSSIGGVGYTDLNAGGDWYISNFIAARRVL